MITGQKDETAVSALNAANAALTAVRQTAFEDALAQYVSERFVEARRVRAAGGIDLELVQSAYAYMGQYMPDEMAKIEPGTDVYMSVTQTKCRALQNWLADIMQSAIDRPFTLSPTPVVEVPPHLEDIAAERLAQIAATNELGIEQLRDMIEEARSLALDQAYASAKTACGRMAKKIEDQLSEGGWRDVYDQFVVDISTMPAAIIRGPRVDTRRRLSFASGVAADVSENVFGFRRVSPFNFYPAPGASSPNDAAYLIEMADMTQSQLVKLKRAVGANAEIIAALIATHPNGYDAWGPHGCAGTKDMFEASALRSGTGTGPDMTYVVAIYNGELPAELAARYGMAVSDHQDFIEVEMWTCGGYVLRALANPYPLGRRPLYVSGFQRRPGSIWFDSLPKVLRDTQRVANAAARAMVKNMAFSAGPIGEVDTEGLDPDNDVTSVQPYRLYRVTRDPMRNDAPVFRFTQIQSTSAQLMRVFDRFSAEADNVSGVPAYVYGSTDVGGAGRTLGGLSMLMGNAAKGIKRVIAFTDNLVIQPVVEMMYAINMLYSTDNTLKADAQVVARGAAGLLQKELSQSRAIELLQVLVQPVVAQSGFVPPQAIPQLLRDVAAGMGYDPDIIPDPNAGQDLVSMLQNAGVQVGSTQAPSVVRPAGGGTGISGLDGRSQPPVSPDTMDRVPAA